MTTRLQDQKVVILGFDGADFDLIDPWIEKGDLPNFARIIREGASGRLQSTIHPNSAQAWTSMVTGVNAGKHGIYDFRIREGGSYKFNFTSSNTRKSPAIWEILNSQGKTAGVINLPLSYPPDEIDGFMITGMHTPDLRRGIYPDELREEIFRKSPEYQIDAQSDWYRRTDHFIDEVMKMLYVRRELSLYLYRKYRPDYFMVVFIASDRIQHSLWQSLEEKNDDNPILNVYREYDRILGEFIDSIDERTSIAVVSDHGFGDLKKDVYLNKFLMDEGFLQIKRSAGEKDRFGFPDIDWSRTRAYSFGSFGNIYINLQGREPGGIVRIQNYDKLCEDITDKLFQLRDPDDNEKVVDRVVLKEEIFSGPYLEDAPDLLAIMRNYSYASRDGFEFDHRSILGPPRCGHGGTHRRKGIFCLRGPGIKSGLSVPDINILDLVPTVLYSMGLPVSPDLDGRPRKEIFEPDGIMEERDSLPPHLRSKEDSAYPFSPREEATIEKRLGLLGYL